MASLITKDSASKSAGQLAYELDVQRKPTYHDGQPRRSWQALPDYAQDSWERNPTARHYPATVTP